MTPRLAFVGGDEASFLLWTTTTNLVAAMRRRLRAPCASLLTLLAGGVAASAREDILFTSSISYCAPPEAILIQQFDLRYVAHNASVVFDVQAASVAPNLSVTANVQLNQYGSNPVNLTIDFCEVLGRALCPLPQYNFSGSGSLPLPNSLDVASRVPSIAYRIPDLEAFAQVTLVDKRTGSVKACVQTTLSNGWSLRQDAVSWAVGAFTLSSALLAAYQIFTGASSVAIQRFIESVLFLQHICYLGMLDLNYPVVFISYAINFSWAVGLFGSSGHLQRSIDRMRDHTGGRHDPPVSPAGTVNRKLSPYNDPLSKTRSLLTLGRGTNSTTPVTVLSSADALAAGIPTYTNSLQISENNAFMSSFIAALLLLALILIFFAIVSVILVIVRRRSVTRSPANLVLCYMAVITGPTMTFAFYQWTLKDSWLSTLLSVFVAMALISAVVICAATFIKHPPSYVLAYRTQADDAPFTNAFAPGRSWLLAITIASTPLKAAFVAFGQSSGIAQLTGILIIELLLLAGHVAANPHRSKTSNWFGLIVGCLRVLSTGLLIAFITTLNVKPIPRVVVGIVCAVILSIGVILFVVSQIISLLCFVFLKHGMVQQPVSQGENDGSSKKVNEKGVSSQDSKHDGRPAELSGNQ